MQNEKADAVRPGPRGFPAVETYRALKAVIFDVDGVLTDGRIVMDSSCVETKFFHVRDGTGITFLRYADIQVGLLTGRTSRVVELRARDLHIPDTHVRQGAKVKLPVFEQMLAGIGLKPEEAAFAGDDIIDLPVLERAGLACCPADAHAEILKVCHVVATRDGGMGGVRQICEHILQQRQDGSWEKAIGRYLGRI